MRKLSKFEIIAGILAPFLLPLFIYFYTFMFMLFVPSRTVNMEIEEELRRMEARGEPIGLEELAPPPVPEEENAAFIYQEAFKKMEELPREIVNLLYRPLSELTDEEKTTIEDFLNKNSETLSLIEEAISYKGCWFPVDYKKGYSVELPHLSKIRNCAYLFAIKSLWELERRNAEEAVNISLKIMKIGEAISSEPVLISKLIRIAIDSIMIGSLEKILREGDVSAETLKRLIDILGAHQGDIRGELKLALLGERCFFIALFQSPEKFLEGTGVDIPPERLKHFIGSRFMRSDELYGLKIYRELIDLSELPFHQALAGSRQLEEEIEKSWEEMGFSLLKPWRLYEFHIFSMMLLPQITGIFVSWARHEAELQEARIAAALELYRIKHGVYPEYLSDIPPEILSPIPVDPFTGDKFIYRREADGFVLYSVGGEPQR